MLLNSGLHTFGAETARHQWPWQGQFKCWWLWRRMHSVLFRAHMLSLWFVGLKFPGLPIFCFEARTWEMLRCPVLEWTTWLWKFGWSAAHWTFLTGPCRKLTEMAAFLWIISELSFSTESFKLITWQSNLLLTKLLLEAAFEGTSD